MFFVRPTLTRFTSFTSAFLIYALIILLGAPFSNAGATSTQPANSVVPLQRQVSARREGQLLVKFRSGISQADRNSVLAAHGVRRKKELRGESGIEQLELMGGQDPQTVALQLLSAPQVEFAEPNFLITKDQVMPGDPSFNEQWALRNTGQNGGQFGSDINITTAWQTTTGTAPTIIPGYTLPYPTDKDNRNLAYSGYWGQALKNACDPKGY